MHCASNNVSGRRPRFRAERGGFTFAEVLAAMVFLAVLVPVVIEGLTLANRAAEVAERKTIATQLAANKLNEIVITEAWSATNSSGISARSGRASAGRAPAAPGARMR